MKCILSALDGTKWETPQVLGWDISHGFGSPCDCFEVKLPLADEDGKILEKTVYVTAEHEDETVFCGIMDEYELSADASGAMMHIRGRGMQARLLDNEAESAQHYYVGLGTLLDTYVRPFGIDKIEMGAAGSARGNLTVDSGASCWSVLNQFCRFHADTMPRFSPQGVLVIDGEKGGGSFVIDEKTPISSMSWREDRYGVISSVIVKNKARGTKTQMTSAEHEAKGIVCRRVINVPRATLYDAMRHTGTYQIQRSAEEMISAEIVLPWAFAAFPGDCVRIENSPVGVNGDYIVASSRCRGDARGVETALTLRPLRG